MSLRCLSNGWLYQNERKRSWGIYSSQVTSILGLQALRNRMFFKKTPQNCKSYAIAMFVGVFFRGGCLYCTCTCRKSTGSNRVDERMCFLLKAGSMCVEAAACKRWATLTGPTKCINHVCLLKHRL